MTDVAGDERIGGAWTTHTHGLASELDEGIPVIGNANAEGCQVTARLGRNSLWLIVQTEGGARFALRTAHAPDGGLSAAAVERDGDLLDFEGDSEAAAFRISVALVGSKVLRVTTRIRPKAPLLVPFWPRDLYPLGPGDDPRKARGSVIAAQRGLNAGVCFFRMEQPAAAALYFQNLTALNPWLEQTETTPDSVVGGEWPELGYQPSAAPLGAEPPIKPLEADREIVLSDAFLYLCDEAPIGEIAEAEMFLRALAAIYPHLEQPETQYRDWPRMARRGLRALAVSPKAGVSRYGCRYLRPYTASEVPDSMAQLAVLLSVREFGAWRGRPTPLEKTLRAGVSGFFDPKLGAIRRYLPNVAKGTEPIEKAKDKDPDEVDSWYLYHPLANVGRLALEGDDEAREMFLGSLDFGIKVARHFDYAWPILFDVQSLRVNTATRGPGQPGQSDVGGLYAYVMLQAFDLTGDKRYCDEAAKAVRRTQGLGFDLLYQTNLTAWSVVACVRLWKVTGDPWFREQSLLFLAGFFHNSIFWNSNLKNARHYETFLGATCLHDAPYMAIYECFESFDAFREYLDMAEEAATPAVRLLLNEYCRHALSRAWGFYPGEVPADALATDIRNGHIDPKLPFPLEDLYADGQPMGQVGQEIYGAGAAFVFTTRSHYRGRDMPFTVYCDYPVRGASVQPGAWSAHIEGWEGGRCRLRIMAKPAVIKSLSVEIGAQPLRGKAIEPGVWEAEAPGRGAVTVRWPRPGDAPATASQ